LIPGKAKTLHVPPGEGEKACLFVTINWTSASWIEANMTDVELPLLSFFSAVLCPFLLADVPRGHPPHI
jgi:hypothetical protein